MQLDIDEALRLMRMSKVSLEDIQGNENVQDRSVTAIYAAIRDDAGRRSKSTYLWSELAALLGRTYTVRPLAYRNSKGVFLTAASFALDCLNRP